MPGLGALLTASTSTTTVDTSIAGSRRWSSNNNNNNNNNNAAMISRWQRSHMISSPSLAPQELRSKVRELTHSLHALSSYAATFTSLYRQWQQWKKQRQQTITDGIAGESSKNMRFEAVTSHAFSFSCDRITPSSRIVDEASNRNRRQPDDGDEQRSKERREDELMNACVQSLGFFKIQSLLLAMETGIDIPNVHSEDQHLDHSSNNDNNKNKNSNNNEKDVNDGTADPLVALVRHLSLLSDLFHKSPAIEDGENSSQTAEHFNEFTLLRDLFFASGVSIPATATCTTISSRAGDEDMLKTASDSVDACGETVSSWMSPAVQHALARYLSLRRLLSAGGRRKLSQTKTDEGTDVSGRDFYSVNTAPQHRISFFSPLSETEHELSLLLPTIDEALLTVGSWGWRPRSNKTVDENDEIEDDSAQTSRKRCREEEKNQRCGLAMSPSLLSTTPQAQARFLIQLKAAALMSVAGFSLSQLSPILAVQQMHATLSLVKVFRAYFTGGGGGGHEENGGNSRRALSASVVAHAGTHRPLVELHLLIACLCMHLSLRDVRPALQRLLQERNKSEVIKSSDIASFDAYEHHPSVRDVMLDVGLPYYHLQAAEELQLSSLCVFNRLNPSLANPQQTTNHNQKASAQEGEMSATLLTTKLLKAVALYQLAVSGESLVLLSDNNNNNSSGDDDDNDGNSRETQEGEEATARESVAFPHANSPHPHRSSDSKRVVVAAAYRVDSVPLTQRHRCSAAVGEILEQLADHYHVSTHSASFSLNHKDNNNNNNNNPSSSDHPNENLKEEESTRPESACWTSANTALFRLLQACFAATEAKDDVSADFYLRRFLKTVSGSRRQSMHSTDGNVGNVFVADALQHLASLVRRRCEEAATSRCDAEPDPSRRLSTADGELRQVDALARQSGTKGSALALLRLLDDACSSAVSMGSLFRNHQNPCDSNDSLSSSSTSAACQSLAQDSVQLSYMNSWRRLQLDLLTGQTNIGEEMDKGKHQDSEQQTEEEARRAALVESLLSVRRPANVPGLRQLLEVVSFLPSTAAYRKLEE